jgi:hypothetical protein
MNEGSSGITGGSNLPPPRVERGGSDPPEDPDGIAFINQYAGAAAQRSTAKHGPLPPQYDIEDIVQAVHLQLRQQVGAGYSLQIAEAAQSKDCTCDAIQKLRAAVKQAIGDHRWRDDKRKQRGRHHVSLSETDIPSRDERDFRDRVIDLSEAMLCLSPLERLVMDLKKEGYTGEEIAQRIPLRDKQEVSAIFREASRKIIQSRKGLK